MNEIAEPTVSIVVPTRDRAERLTRTLDAIAAQDFDRPFEVIVVDDASSDDTAAILDARRQTGLRVERRSSPGGPGGARNTGWQIAQAPLIAFTDDDCEPTSGWLSALVAEARPDCFVQGPTRPNPAELDRMGPFSRTLDVGSLGPWFPASNLAYPKQMLERLGGFDESLIRGEDTDLACRAQEAGFTPRWAEQALVWHAVMELGAVGKLRLAAAWTPAARVLAAHPQLREHLVAGVFWKRSHALLVLAALGLLIGRRWRPAALLAVPYLYSQRPPVGASWTAARWIPYQALHDLIEIAALAWGSVGARTIAL